jgi:endonuclease/exonuclease/phosphatase family metal-dependent hydrolase
METLPVLSYDHIFISNDLDVEAVLVPADKLSRMASDHLPFFVQLSLSGISVIDGQT